MVNTAMRKEERNDSRLGVGLSGGLLLADEYLLAWHALILIQHPSLPTK